MTRIHSNRQMPQLQRGILDGNVVHYSAHPLGHRMSTTETILQRSRLFLLHGESLKTRPYWPKGKSGVTWGVGWDAGQHTAHQIRQIWNAICRGDLDRLAGAAHLTGTEAEDYLPKVEDIEIPKDVCLRVFGESLRKYYRLIGVVFPGAYSLPTDVQVVLISLIYNRGTSMYDRSNKKHTDPVIDSRYEMRLVRNAVHQGDIVGIYDALRRMERVWHGTKIEKGMKKRREDEAALLRPYLLSFPDLRNFRG